MVSRIRLRTWIERALAVASMLFLLQALRVLFSVMFGFIYDQVFEGPLDAWLPVSHVLILLAFLLPGLLPARWANKGMGWVATGVAAGRIALSFNDPWIRYAGSLLVIALAGIFLAGLMARDSRRAALSVIWALIIEMLLRVVGDTLDASLGSSWIAIFFAWYALSLLAVAGLRPWEDGAVEASIPDRRWGWALGGFLFLEASLLSLPHAIGHWTGAHYAMAAPLLAATTCLALFPSAQRATRLLMAVPFLRVMTLVLFGGGLMLAYFSRGVASLLALLLCQWGMLSIWLAKSDQQVHRRGKSGWRVSAGLIILLILNYVNAFAFTYPYTLPFMREKGWVVYLAAFLALAAGAAGRAREPISRDEPEPTWLAMASMVVLAIVFVAVWPQAPHPLGGDGKARLATYNIHYGYDDDWHLTIEDMAQTIADAGVDIIALQEVDVGRMTSYSMDNAYYLGRRLGMNVAYLPTVEHLTGIALLYKGSPGELSAKLLTSRQEQTGIVGAHLEDAGLHAYGIWLGLSDEDTLRQIDEALAFIGDRVPAAFGGDFNSRPDDPEIGAIKEAGFQDPFEVLGIDPAPPTSPAVNPQSRIDFVFLRGLEPLRAWVPESTASDHRMMVVDVVLP